MWSLVALALSAAPPEAALLCTAPQEPYTELRFQPLGQTELAGAVARLEHVAGESVQGALLPGRRAVVAVAVAEQSKDLSFASHLYLLEPGKPARELADRVLLGQRPFVSSTGRVFVARGKEGPQRVDAITVDEVDVRTGKARTVLSFAGFAAFVFGEHQGFLAIYKITPEGGEFLTVHPDALGIRVHARVYPLARDFSVDTKAGAFVYTQGDASGRWWVETLDLATGKTQAAHHGSSMALLPTVFPDGTLAVSNRRRVRAFVGALAVGLDEFPDGTANPFAVDWKRETKVAFSAPAGFRLDLAGVVQP